MAEQFLKDKDYNLISVVYHAAQGAEICGRYAQDAQQAGDNDAVQFFNEARSQSERLIQRGKELLKSRL